ncbi:MAG: hypothetical protein ING75_17090 [Rhodocyclaceae bacterium]|nr:hypothetical protein [Rhodocyclaceae bacterium]
MSKVVVIRDFGTYLAGQTVTNLLPHQIDSHIKSGDLALVEDDPAPISRQFPKQITQPNEAE